MMHDMVVFFTVLAIQCVGAQACFFFRGGEGEGEGGMSFSQPTC